MLIPAARLDNLPVMSLQTGARLAQTTSPVIDPRNLTILAYELTGPKLDTQPSFLMVQDIRELSNLGLIVDSNDEFVAVDDVIKLKEAYDLSFTLLGKAVVDQNKHKLGKVTGYSVEPESFMIKQLNVKRPILKSFTDTELLIDRTQIIEVTDDQITIEHDERQPAPVKQATNAYTNPFRSQSAQPEAIQRQHPPR